MSLRQFENQHPGEGQKARNLTRKNSNPKLQGQPQVQEQNQRIVLTNTTERTRRSEPPLPEGIEVEGANPTWCGRKTVEATDVEGGHLVITERAQLSNRPGVKRSSRGQTMVWLDRIPNLNRPSSLSTRKCTQQGFNEDP